MLNVDDAQRRQAGTTLYECSFLSLSLSTLSLSCHHHWPMRKNNVYAVLFLDVMFTRRMLYVATKDTERFIFHSRWSCVLYVHFLFIHWSAITTTMSNNSKETMTKKQQDDLTSTFNSNILYFFDFFYRK
jgi:hypothetical protein